MKCQTSQIISDVLNTDVKEKLHLFRIQVKPPPPTAPPPPHTHTHIHTTTTNNNNNSPPPTPNRRHQFTTYCSGKGVISLIKKKKKKKKKKIWGKSSRNVMFKPIGCTVIKIHIVACAQGHFATAFLYCIGLDKRGYPVYIFLISPRKHML